VTAAGVAASLNGSACGERSNLPHAARLAVAVMEGRLCSDAPLESDAREEKKNSSTLQA